jgi:hypothetical protein
MAGAEERAGILQVLVSEDCRLEMDRNVSTTETQSHREKAGFLRASVSLW